MNFFDRIEQCLNPRPTFDVNYHKPKGKKASNTDLEQRKFVQQPYHPPDRLSSQQINPYKHEKRNSFDSDDEQKHTTCQSKNAVATDGLKRMEDLPKPDDEPSNLKQNFTAAYPWLEENMKELSQYGWSRSTLLGKGKHKFPLGTWGIAWFSIWVTREMTVRIDAQTGAIRFTFPGSDGRTVTQTAYPPPQDIPQAKKN